jgi:hypothetical protein
MARATRRRPGEAEDEREEEREGGESEPQPLDSGTVQSLREADPAARAQAILRLQRLHGNAAVQRVIHSLQVTDAGRDARVQQIGDRAEDPAPSGKLEKAELYREAIEAELDATPVASKSERDIVVDSVNTIGQIFANYQAALHMFEEAIGTGMGEAVPQELAKEILREGARDVLEPVFAAASETAGELGDQVARGMGTPDQVRKEKPRASATSAPAYALTNLVLAERRRIAQRQMKLLKAQVSFGELGATRAGVGGGAFRERLTGANLLLNKLEETSHSAHGIYKTLMERYKKALVGRTEVTILVDPQWRVVRAHITAANGRKLASQLLQEHSGWFPLDALHLARHLTWEPAELATCEALFDARGTLRATMRNQRGAAHFDEFQQRLRTEGLPHTHVLTGD